MPYKWIAKACERLLERQRRRGDGNGTARRRDGSRDKSRDRSQDRYQTGYSRNLSRSPRTPKSAAVDDPATIALISKVAHFAWAACGDAMLDSSLALDRDPKDLAAACIYLGIKLTGSGSLLDGLDVKGGDDAGFVAVSSIIRPSLLEDADDNRSLGSSSASKLLPSARPTASASALVASWSFSAKSTNRSSRLGLKAQWTMWFCG